MIYLKLILDIYNICHSPALDSQGPEFHSHAEGLVLVAAPCWIYIIIRISYIIYYIKYILYFVISFINDENPKLSPYSFPVYVYIFSYSNFSSLIICDLTRWFKGCSWSREEVYVINVSTNDEKKISDLSWIFPDIRKRFACIRVIN